MMIQMKIYEFSVDKNDVRVDTYISENIHDMSRSYAAKLASDGLVFCNGKQVPKSHKLILGDKITVNVNTPTQLNAIPQEIKLDIVYEDEYLLVVNKEKSMVVHPAAGNNDGTLVNALMHHCKGNLSAINGVLRPGIVHRIDKNTSGLLVVAKDNNTHAHLAQQFANHTITRQYYAVVHGKIKNAEGFIQAGIARHPIERKKMTINNVNGKNAYTSYKVLKNYNGFTLICAQLKTGRTHQIRVHMASCGHPLAGDDVYGPKKCIKSLNGQCLHAKTLGFIHPNTSEYIEFNSELPQYFVNFINCLKEE